MRPDLPGFPGEEMARRILALTALAVCGTTTLLAQQLPNYPDKPVAFSIGHPTAQHVILISIDGMHALDLANYVAAHPDSTLAELSRRGTTYTNAHTPWSDGAPGMVALDGDSVEGVVDTVQKDLAAHVTTDTIRFIWVNSPS